MSPLGWRRNETQLDAREEEKDFHAYGTRGVLERDHIAVKMP